jgi:hypothetical protein
LIFYLKRERKIKIKNFFYLSFNFFRFIKEAKRKKNKEKKSENGKSKSMIEQVRNLNIKHYIVREKIRWKYSQPQVTKQK